MLFAGQQIYKVAFIILMFILSYKLSWNKTWGTAPKQL